MPGNPHPARILSETDRWDIRAQVGKPCKYCGKKVTQADMARKYGVSDATISNLIREKKYFR